MFFEKTDFYKALKKNLHSRNAVILEIYFHKMGVITANDQYICNVNFHKSHDAGEFSEA